VYITLMVIYGDVVMWGMVSICLIILLNRNISIPLKYITHTILISNGISSVVILLCNGRLHYPALLAIIGIVMVIMSLILSRLLLIEYALLKRVEHTRLSTVIAVGSIGIVYLVAYLFIFISSCC
jgi:hypothetical protein